ncbi:MAG: GlsB/YeaQ/YmgE family stress response membrane protein [Lachnospiraceae bacterium]|nr:GlsB/YeaQ/YmgE family stress response membrane protein [Lachnospiraceae bacterium]
MSFIAALIVGGISGWLAGKIMESKHNIIVNIILGLVGGALGGLLGSLIGIGATGTIGSIIISVIGACILIWLSRLIFK